MSEAKNEFRIEGGVVWIKLTQGKETRVDLADWERVKALRWYAYSCPRRHTFYAMARDAKFKRPVALHKLLIAGSFEVDHRDGNGLNNQRLNLRRATRAENARNSRKRKDNTSGYKGVCWNKRGQKWQAQIRHNYKQIHLGRFNSPEEAARAYDVKATKLFGDFALLNFPD